MSQRNTEAPRVVYEGKYQRMLVRGTWEYSERTHAGGLAAIIIAVTPEDKVLFVEQFRVPLQAPTIEMPAGLVGDIHAGESIEVSAVRELEEETGWTADHAEVLMIGPTSSGASSEKIAFVRATGLRRIGEGGGDDSEDITVHEIPRSEAAAWLVQKMGEGYELDAKLWAGLWMIEHHLTGARVADADLHALPALLGADDPAIYAIHRPQGASPYLLLADHAGQQVPHALAGLGLPQVELDRHIGWDIGIAGTTRALAERLDAWAIEQTYSRLLIDCNRPLASPTLIPEVSDHTVVPGNAGLSAAQRQQRIDAIHAPYHARIDAELDARRDAGRPTLLVMMHSFTPAMNGMQRPWHAGVLYHQDTRFAHALLQALRDEGDLVVGDNEPYSVSSTSDYAVPVHGEGRGLVHVELEIRQDLIADAAGQQAWAERLARIFSALQPQLLAAG